MFTITSKWIVQQRYGPFLDNITAQENLIL